MRAEIDLFNIFILIGCSTLLEYLGLKRFGNFLKINIKGSLQDINRK